MIKLDICETSLVKLYNKILWKLLMAKLNDENLIEGRKTIFKKKFQKSPVGGVT